MKKRFNAILTTMIIGLSLSVCTATKINTLAPDAIFFFDDFDNGMSPWWMQVGDCSWSTVGGVLQTAIFGYNNGCVLQVGDSSWTDYVFEYDVRGNAGVDKTVGFRQGEGRGYGFLIRSDWLTGDEAILTRLGYDAQISLFPSQNGIWYHVKITCIGNHIWVSIDGVEVIDYVDPDTPSLSGWIALSAWTGAAGECDISFDNVVVTGPPSVPGDVDGNGIVSISDAVFLINYIFAGGPAPNPLLAGDADCTGAVSISDAVYLINYIFAGGPAPCEACS